jgi:nucleoside-diphosphate-sugar epimerase
MQTKPLIAVIGADGFVGGGFAEGLQGQRIVYGPCRPGDIHIKDAEPLIRQADVIINAGGFRVRRGLTLDDYRRCHQVATAAFLPWVKPGTLFLHMSSAHVLGKSRREKPGNDSPPNPASYPPAAYAIAKYECDQYLERESVNRDFRLVLLRPTILWARPGDTSLIDNVCKLARRGIIMRMYPRDARHHFCHLSILVEVARRVIQKQDLPQRSALVVGDPYTVTSRQLEAMIREYLPGGGFPAIIPAPLMSALLRPFPRSRHARLDFKTWGEIFGVFHLDTEYDTFETFRPLDMDPEQYSLERMLKPFLRQALQATAAADQMDAVGAETR